MTDKEDNDKSDGGIQINKDGLMLFFRPPMLFFRPLDKFKKEFKKFWEIFEKLIGDEFKINRL